LEKQEDIVLTVENLHTYFHTTLGTVRALNGVSYSVPKGKVLGIVGESGCGKSVTSLAVMQLVRHPGKIEQGTIMFQTARRGDGEWVDITALDRHSDEMHEIRSNEISMIFQEPMTSLNPVFSIGQQISEAVLLHQGVDNVYHCHGCSDGHPAGERAGTGDCIPICVRSDTRSET
jgi:peptide/nickel transport system ATP-binding protein